MLPGPEYMSDSLDKAAGENLESLPPEVLAKVTLLNFPPPKLRLKEGMLIVCLRNLTLSGGLANGTRLLVKCIKPKVLKCTILTGPMANEEIYLPKISLIHKPDTQFSSRFLRYQFPVAPAFAMTVNKSQGF
ncbi:hypothetical protein PCASD_04106 [Puccinia coronata f. sp. avenae]|uniref:DNA helicase Pif1-like 2B domain-containing protein n=1 Tax=Puccinia coronata f. sp. avenae TaxID=200324 RepID=A0A2N5VCD8_9BASI|nr:hypothetical protein PCASD_04106 [Puccinia coronata f. sp. avenae]